ncbi:tubulin-specific chaperone cofactor E-like protein [Branchiostoma lanceolatum]|uniref:tubulin-specific chaperone cofactor E-like protein n=1 Tax=Branchiostoma lanceolatum TaxID=7740 RepID=UPI003452C3A2
MGSQHQRKPTARSFVQALRDKYCLDADEGFGDGGGTGFVEIMFVTGPRTPRKEGRTAGKAELGHLKAAVLDHGRITYAGIPPGGLADLCPNITDLDVSNNHLASWRDVLSVLSGLPKVKSVSFSFNLLQNDKNLIDTWTEPFGQRLEHVMLNGTGAAWDVIKALGRRLPSLKELHLCKNGYEMIDFDSAVDPAALARLEILTLNENHIRSWQEVWKLRFLPSLQSLILSGNPLEDLVIPEVIDSTADDVCSDDTASTRKNQEQSHHVSDPSQKVPASMPSSETESQSEDDAADINVNYSEIQDLVRDVLGKVTRSSLENLKKSVVEEFRSKCTVEDSPTESKDESHPADQSDGSRKPSDQSPNSCHTFDQSGNDSEALSQSDGCLSSQTRPADNADMTPFAQLKSLFVSDTSICSWRDLEALQNFPKLDTLRIQGIPLLRDASQEERRQLFIASLPSVTKLNGSRVADSEREKAERFFLRHFADKDDQPATYRLLKEKHGELSPARMVDIRRGFNRFAEVRLVYGGRTVEEATLRTNETIGKLKIYCARLVKQYPGWIKLYLVAKSSWEDGTSEMQELFLDSLPLSRYDVKDGDEILIDVSKSAGRDCRLNPSGSRKVTSRYNTAWYCYN